MLVAVYLHNPVDGMVLERVFDPSKVGGYSSRRNANNSGRPIMFANQPVKLGRQEANDVRFTSTTTSVSPKKNRLKIAATHIDLVVALEQGLVDAVVDPLLGLCDNLGQFSLRVGLPTQARQSLGVNDLQSALASTAIPPGITKVVVALLSMSSPSHS